jgi:AhpD family alkylhydroperoxidase
MTCIYNGMVSEAGELGEEPRPRSAKNVEGQVEQAQGHARPLDLVYDTSTIVSSHAVSRRPTRDRKTTIPLGTLHSRAAPRIAPGRLRDLGLVNWLLCRLISRGVRVPDAHLFSTLGRQRRLFRCWLVFAGRLMPGGSLTRAESELVILRVAHMRRCTYEEQHHARLARRAGLDRAAVARAAAGPDAAGWSDREHALLRAVDALLTTRDIDDATWESLRVHFREAQLVELCLLVGHYDMLAMTIHALRVAPDFDPDARAAA